MRKPSLRDGNFTKPKAQSPNKTQRIKTRKHKQYTDMFGVFGCLGLCLGICVVYVLCFPSRSDGIVACTRPETR